MHLDVLSSVTVVNELHYDTVSQGGGHYLEVFPVAVVNELHYDTRRRSLP